MPGPRQRRTLSPSLARSSSGTDSRPKGAGRTGGMAAADRDPTGSGAGMRGGQLSLAEEGTRSRQSDEETTVKLLHMVPTHARTHADARPRWLEGIRTTGCCSEQRPNASHAPHAAGSSRHRAGADLHGGSRQQSVGAAADGAALAAGTHARLGGNGRCLRPRAGAT